MTTLRGLAGATLVLAVFGVALAKLPAPPPMTDAQKAAAEEKKAKDAAAAELAKQQQPRAEDRVAARYIAEQKAKGNTVTPQTGPASAAATAMAAPAAAPSKAGATPAKAPEAAAPAKKKTIACGRAGRNINDGNRCVPVFFIRRRRARRPRARSRWGSA
jgi:hypothetical protein